MSAIHMEEERKLEPELTLEEVAEAMRVSPDTVVNRIRAGKLVARREGKLYRIKKSDLAAYIESTRIHPDEKGE